MIVLRGLIVKSVMFVYTVTESVMTFDINRVIYF